MLTKEESHIWDKNMGERNEKRSRQVGAFLPIEKCL